MTVSSTNPSLEDKIRLSSDGEECEEMEESHKEKAMSLHSKLQELSQGTGLWNSCIRNCHPYLIYEGNGLGDLVTQSPDFLEYKVGKVIKGVS